jgi:hypothetical protein
MPRADRTHLRYQWRSFISAGPLWSSESPPRVKLKVWICANTGFQLIWNTLSPDGQAKPGWSEGERQLQQSSSGLTRLD